MTPDERLISDLQLVFDASPHGLCATATDRQRDAFIFCVTAAWNKRTCTLEGNETPATWCEETLRYHLPNIRG